VTWVAAGWPAQRQLGASHGTSCPSAVISERAQRGTWGLFEVGGKLSADVKGKL